MAQKIKPTGLIIPVGDDRFVAWRSIFCFV